MLRFFMFVGLSLLSSVVKGQYSLTGTITDCLSRAPLSGATVELVGQQKTVQTNAQGQFSFQDLSKGTHHFYVSQDDYKGHFFKVSIKRNEKNYIFALCN
ncbi:carboxypeptidase regulatory-like domain-containing protein [Capnocytophaga sp. oral taxon 863]|uniref:carboxypeptidase regulatory-like domain-containing protein n=1 Tax=Capnocytophaga sp. oral taxon 863 TaxID=1227265 RepID=UPI0004225918|nr:carboxypeptidase regulatory-like domain-containing protein [Capnocytophaga sp. oral taxon 863]